MRASRGAEPQLGLMISAAFGAAFAPPKERTGFGALLSLLCGVDLIWWPGR